MKKVFLTFSIIILLLLLLQELIISMESTYIVRCDGGEGQGFGV